MQCPICKRETPLEGNPFRPFCSERCKMIDLGNWLEGRYRIPGTTSEQQKHNEPSTDEIDEEGNDN